MADRSTTRRTTLADVAAATGVSKATVSKVLNGRDDVGGATRERVLGAVAALDYRPTTSHVLAANRRAIAVVYDIPASPYILGVLQGVLTEASDGQLDLLTRLAPEHAQDLLSALDPPTAIMAADDELAVGVLAAAHELGIRVPDDLSVTGFDDTPQASWTTPPLVGDARGAPRGGRGVGDSDCRHRICSCLQVTCGIRAV